MAEFLYACENDAGVLSMQLTDAAGNVVWQYRHPCFYEDSIASELVQDDTLIEMGVMKNTADTDGLQKMLHRQGILKENDHIVTSFTQYANGGHVKDDARIARAKAADLIEFRKDISGTNCANCQFVEVTDEKKGEGICKHPEVGQPVTSRMCCIYWDDAGTKRVWEMLANKEVFRSAS